MVELKSKYFRLSKESETWFTYNCYPEARRFPFQWWADFPMKEQKAVPHLILTETLTYFITLVLV